MELMEEQKNHSILIVDDEAIIRGMLEIELEERRSEIAQTQEIETLLAAQLTEVARRKAEAEREAAQARIRMEQEIQATSIQRELQIREAEIAQLRSVLTLLGGRVVHGEGDFAPLAPALPPVMPDWSPVATFGGYHQAPTTKAKLADACGCTSGCAVHGHDHAAALDADVPVADARSFWGVFGCSCWAV